MPVSSPREAELTKLLENTFRHVNIALVNELAMFADDLGIDVWEAIDAASTKPFGYMRFTPGPGVGGHCLPDRSVLPVVAGAPVARAPRSGSSSWPTTSTTTCPTTSCAGSIVGLNRRELPVNGQRILLLGLAYKRNTGDARESPSRPDRPPARRARRRGPGRRPARASTTSCPTASPASSHRRAWSPRAPRWCCSSTTTPSTSTSSPTDAAYVLDTRHCVAGDNVEYL